MNTDSNGRKSFPIFLSFGRMANYLNDTDAGKLFKAVVAYAENRKEPDFSNNPMLMMAFDNFRTTEDDNLAKWIEMREKRVKAGLKSGEVRGKKKQEQEQEENEWREILDLESDTPFS